MTDVVGKQTDPDEIDGQIETKEIVDSQQTLPLETGLNVVLTYSQQRLWGPRLEHTIGLEM